MVTPVRLQLSRAKGFDLQAWSREVNGLAAINVSRPGPFGNPYRIGEPVDAKQVRRWGWKFGHLDTVCADAAEAVRRFRACLFLDEAIHDHVRKKLAGCNVACWCDLGELCHGGPLLELANTQRERQKP